jgi:hypothetical protein
LLKSAVQFVELSSVALPSQTRSGDGIWLCTGPGVPRVPFFVRVPKSERIVKIDSSRLTAYWTYCPLPRLMTF